MASAAAAAAVNWLEMWGCSEQLSMGEYGLKQESAALLLLHSKLDSC